MGRVNANSRKTACKYGHPFDAANTIGEGRRDCRACHTRRSREARARRRTGPRRTGLNFAYLELGPEDCWPWMGALDAAGYGKVRARGAHRVVYEQRRGLIPEGLCLDHLCRNPMCVNPAHLEPVTNRENVLRGLRGRLITHCPQGHPYNEDNTYVYERPNGSERHCRACNRAAKAGALR